MSTDLQKQFVKVLGCLLLLLGIIACPFKLQAQSEPPSGFVHLSVEDGLSDGTVLDLMQDDQGFMWFATQNGLARYDGYDFIVYTHDPRNPNSLSHNNVASIYQDDSGVIWAGTQGGGLNRLDKKTGQITHFTHDADEAQSLSNNFVHAIKPGEEGKLWIGTDGGLTHFDPQSGTAVHYPDDPTQSKNPDYLKIRDVVVGPDQTVWLATTGGLAWLAPGAKELAYSSEQVGVDGFAVWKLHLDDQGFLWAGTDNGLYKLNDSRRVAAHYQHDPDNPSSLGPGTVVAIYGDSQGRLWLGTRGGGLSLFDPAQELFTPYQHDPEDPHSLSNDFVIVISEDDAGTLWIGNWAGGLNLMSPYFYRFPPSIPLDSTIPLAFHEEANGTLWVGTMDQGLLHLDSRTGERTSYGHDAQDEGSLSNDTVFALAADEQGGLWLGTHAGLNYFDPATKNVARYALDPLNPDSPGGQSVRSLHMEDDGGLWAGTTSGLFYFDPQTAEATSYSETAGGPGSSYIRKILPSGSDSFWIGAGNGLFKLNRETGEFQDLTEMSDTRDTGITTIYEDAQGVLWLGTWGYGLIRFDPAAGTSAHYQSAEGLPGSIVLGILPDEGGNLWLSTNRGLSRFDPAAETFRTYDRHNGLAGDDFAQGAYLQNELGEMFLGIENGIIHFRPTELADNPHLPPVVLTKFQLFNQDVPVGGDSPLSESINYASELVLDHDDSVFSFEFAALNFINPQRNQYAYKMEGVDPQWNEVGTRRFVTYTNLDPGQYQFKVRAANSDGLWNEDGVNLRIIVQPPWWQTPMAYLLYTLAFFALIGGTIWRGSRAQARQLERQRRELLWERRLRESLEQMDRLKDEERGRIARELHDGLAQTLAGIRFRARTWKTLLKRDPEQLLPELDELGVVLDMSIRDVRRSIYALRPVSLEQLGLEKALLRFTADLAKLYQIEIETDLRNMDALPEKLEVDLFRITQELVYNAIQHGRPQSTLVQIAVTGDTIKVKVADNGIGFDPQQLPPNDSEGHFGLIQVRERVRLLKGTMSIDSHLEEGTTVTIELPLAEE